MDVSKRLLTTMNHRKIAFIGQIAKGKDITNNLLLGLLMAREGEKDQKLDIATTPERFLVEEIWVGCTEWHRIEGNGEPWWFILNLLLDDDDDLTC